MSSKLERLMFHIGLVDKASGKASAIQNKLDQMNKHAQLGFTRTAKGAAGLFATGYALKSVLSPAIEMDRALGEVRSLDVAGDAMRHLEKDALKFSMQYGASASDFVKSSYDIQSAIAGLKGNELASFTRASAVLAKGTKSDVATITNYMGTMYGIFETQANNMGKADWVKAVSGKTASAVQMFKTTGSEMAAAFSGLGATGNTYKVSMEEQMAVLGMLQSTMSGTEAATKYKSFLQGAAKAQDALGISLTDSTGKLLPMNKMLKLISENVGDLSKPKNAEALKKAFGRKEAVDLIALLSTKTAALTKNVDALGKVNGLSKAEHMAKQMVDPFQQLQAAGKGLTQVLGTALLPVVVPLAQAMHGWALRLASLSERFPMATKAVGMLTLGIITLLAVGSGVAILGGMVHLMTAAFVGLGVAKSVLTALTVKTWLFNAALLANPITWIVIAAVAAIGALSYGIYQVYKHWDTLVAAWRNLNVMDWLGKKIDWLISKLNMIPGIDIDTRFSDSDLPETGQSQQNLGVRNKVPEGGVMQQFSGGKGSATTVENLNLYSSEPNDSFAVQNLMTLIGNG